MLYQQILLFFLIVVGVYYAKPLLVPICISGILATLFLPFCRWLENKKMKRGLAVSICFALFIVGVFSILSLIGWQIGSLVKDLPLLKEKIAESYGADQIVIDTAGINPFDPESVKLVARLIGAADCDPVLVIPAGIDADESGEIARVFATIGAKAMIPTRVDVARRLGSLLSAAHHGGLVLAEVSSTAKVADGLSPLSAKRLTQLLMPRAESAEALANARKAG